VSLGVESHESTAKKVELDCELGAEVSIQKCELLMGSEDILWVIFEVKDGDNILIADSLDPGVSELSHLVEWHLIFRVEHGIFNNFLPFCDLF
jgi:hypothetical protein